MALVGLHTQITSHSFRRRLWGVTLGMTIGCLLLLFRLYNLQILRGEELSHKGRRNFVQNVRIAHDRGMLFDRSGVLLVDNRPSLNLQLIPAFLGRKSEVVASLQQLGELLNWSYEERERMLTLVRSKTGLHRFKPLILRRDLNASEIDSIESRRSLFGLNGVSIVEGRRRTYHYASTAAHLLGYVNEIDPQALDAERLRGNPLRYDLGDMIGREGAERTYETELRGMDGLEKVVVDAKGRLQQLGYIEQLLGEQRSIPPKPGNNVYLSIDIHLQQVAEQTLLAKGMAGSVVALNVRTGQVLVLASIPAFNPNAVSGTLDRDVKQALDNDPLKPWLNRAIAGQYVPGSTFKVVTALAALQQGVVVGPEKVNCPGSFRLGRHTWRCWRDAGHGPLDMYHALKVSCDTYFYTQAAAIGINPIAGMARELGFGQRTGLPLRGEQPGLVPDEAFHQRIDSATGGYQKGMAINTAIGQGSLLVTPLQLALAYGAIANGGTVFVPQLLHKITTPDLQVLQQYLSPQVEDVIPMAAEDNGRLLSPVLPGEPVLKTTLHGEPAKVVRECAPEIKHQLSLEPGKLQQVQAGLIAVTSEPGGTGYYSRSRLVTTAGKTGTAQVVKLGRERLKEWQIPYEERDHAWFVAYAPAEQPEVVIAVLNEHAGHGGSASAPVAVAVLDAYIQQQRYQQQFGVP